MKKLLLWAMAIAVVAMSCSKDDSSNADSSANLLQIYDVDDLAIFITELESNPSYNAKLMDDIELSGEWVPIPTVYSGTFNGNGKTISGLTITASSGSQQGFFAKTDGATIQDLTISCTISNETTDATVATGEFVATGAFAATAYNSTFKNCSTTDNSTVTGLGKNTAGISGWVENATFENCTNRATISGYKFSAGIVGYIGGEIVITNCTNEGSITNNSDDGYTAGIVAYVAYIDSNASTTITNCANSGSVTSTSDAAEAYYIGGIVGRLASVTIITDCTNVAEITGFGYLGGIVGSASTSGSTISGCSNEGEIKSDSKCTGGVAGYASSNNIITNCYNTAAVSGGQYTAGISGYCKEMTISNCGNSGDVAGTSSNVGGISGANITTTIINCYNTAAISTTEGSSVAGIAAYNDANSSIVNCYSSQDGIVSSNSGTTTLCYYDSGDNDVAEVSGIIGVSTATMTSSDFVATLCANAQEYNNLFPTPTTLACSWVGVSSSYPTLNFSSIPSPRGVKSWNISNATELKAMLGTIGGGTYYTYDTYNLTADITLTEEWTPVTEVFSGTLNGNGKTISGLKIETPSGTQQGFFAETDGATIQDLTISCTISNETTGTSAATGAFVAQAYNTTFKNCSTTDDSTVTGSGNNTAGVSGWVENSTFENCTNLATINGCKYSAGIIGYTSTTGEITITNCTNEGTITSSSEDYTAGIAAVINATATITNCTNNGDVTSNGSDANYTAGIAGRFSGATIATNCTNSATITGYKYVGGIVGSMGSSGSTLSGCSNSGSIIATNNIVGGVTGYANTGSIITDCYNTGDVSGEQYVAGISGYCYSEVTTSNCGNSGDVTGASYNVGGITGANNSSTIINCYNTASISTTESSYVAGIAADSNSSSSIINCYNQGDISHDNSGIAYRNQGSMSNCYSSQDGIVSSNSGTATNCYYDSGDSDVAEASGVIGVSTATMTSSDFAATLNTYVADYNNESGEGTTPDILALTWKAVSGSYPTFE